MSKRKKRRKRIEQGVMRVMDLARENPKKTRMFLTATAFIEASNGVEAAANMLSVLWDASTAGYDPDVLLDDLASRQPPHQTAQYAMGRECKAFLSACRAFLPEAQACYPEETINLFNLSIAALQMCREANQEVAAFARERKHLAPAEMMREMFDHFWDRRQGDPN